VAQDAGLPSGVAVASVPLVAGVLQASASQQLSTSGAACNGPCVDAGSWASVAEYNRDS
jgi:hypothetical protein